MPVSRPRISLLTSVLLMTITAMAVALWQQGNKVLPLREEVRRLRLIAGHLHVEDPTKLHAVGTETAERDFWRWRVFIPEGPTFYLHNQPFDVPKEGTPTQRVPRSGSPLEPGEHFFSYRIKQVDGETDRLTSLLRGRSDNNVYGTEIEIRERKADWIDTKYSKHRLEGGGGSMLSQVVVPPDQPLILLKIRAKKARITKYDEENNPASWHYDEIAAPTDGVMIWIDQHEDNSGYAHHLSGESL